MKFTPTALDRVMLIDLEPLGDERGFFARAYDVHEFDAHQLTARVVQANFSYNRHRGTLRGMHYQVAPAQESKHIRTIRGAAHFVVVDLRPDSPTRRQHVSAEISAANRRSLLVPEGCAVGMQTLEDETELFYQVSAFYSPEHERGLRYNDPALGIAWPLSVAVISEKDNNWPLLSEAASS